MATRQREKAEKFAKERDKRPTCIAKYIRIPSDKVGIVLDSIRGKSYEEAAVILKNTNKSASPVILKVLNSAAANAENNLNMSKDTLFVAQCYAMPGPTLKRMMPRARGRADRLLKRTCHIRVILDEKKTGAASKPETTKTKSAEVKVTPKKTTPAKTSTGKPVGKSPAKEIPSTSAEKPLTEIPNAKKPLGTKKEVKK